MERDTPATVASAARNAFVTADPRAPFAPVISATFPIRLVMIQCTVERSSQPLDRGRLEHSSTHLPLGAVRPENDSLSIILPGCIPASGNSVARQQNE